MWIIRSLMALSLWLQSNQNIQNQKLETRHFNYTDITYRHERWANEERLFTDFSRYQKIINTAKTSRQIREENIKKERINYIKNTHPEEYHIDKTITKLNGRELRRELDYFYDKETIFLHHSAMPTKYINNKEQMEKQIRDIQKLHSFSRERWDVGYHFLVDKYGNIYEWKAWWPWIVWAHAQFNNFNSIGINILGNMQNEKITEAQLKSILALLVSITDYYNIDIASQHIFHKKTFTKPYIEDVYFSPLAYHKVVSNTSCPGEDTLKYIPFIHAFIKTYKEQFPLATNHIKVINFIYPKIDKTSWEENITTQLQSAFAEYKTELMKNQWTWVNKQTSTSGNKQSTNNQIFIKDQLIAQDLLEEINKQFQLFETKLEVFSQNPNYDTRKDFSTYYQKLKKTINTK